jgi:predicted GNAT family N-acyltransferase
MFRIRPVSSKEDWEMARGIRQLVFVEEQACPPEEEWDEHDASSRHFIGLVDGLPVATARWRTVPFEGRLVAKLERFAVRPGHRGRGYGRALVRTVQADARRAGFHTFIIHAQAHLEHYYSGLGFVAFGDRFVEAGIPHIGMLFRPQPEGEDQDANSPVLHPGAGQREGPE